MRSSSPAPNDPGFLRRHPIRIAMSVLAVGFVAWLAFGYFEIHALVIDDKVDEAAPFSIAVGTPTTLPADGSGSAPSVPGAATGAPSPSSAAAPTVTNRGSFVDRSHPTDGDAVVITDGTTTFLRLVEFSTDNGPDLFVYLSGGVTTDTPAGRFDDDFVDLGRLKGNIGAQNYVIPPGTDLSRYRTVVVWCRRFTTAFGAADLAPT